MTTLLHIVASPQADTQSFSTRIGQAFVSAYRETHPDHTIDTLNVWEEELPGLGALTASWKLKTMGGMTPTAEEDAERQKLQAVVDRFKAADKYVLSVPMWNFSVPYRLKHFFDVIVQPGMTFGFDPAKGYFGLVPAERPVYVVETRGSSFDAASGMAALDFQRPWLSTIFNFMGLSNVTHEVVDCTAYGPQVSDPLLAASVARAMTAARTF